MKMLLSEQPDLLVQLKPIVSQAISRELRKLRKQKGLSGQALGQLLNLSQQQISRYENGKNLISFDVLTLLLYVLDTKPIEFMYRTCGDIEQAMLHHRDLNVLFPYSMQFNRKLAHVLPPDADASLLRQNERWGPE